MACRFSRCPACGFSLAASFRTSLSVVNRLIRPAGFSPTWLPASPAHTRTPKLERLFETVWGAKSGGRARPEIGSRRLAETNFSVRDQMALHSKSQVCCSEPLQPTLGPSVLPRACRFRCLLRSSGLIESSGKRRGGDWLARCTFDAAAGAELFPCPEQPADEGRGEPERPCEHEEAVPPD